MTKHMWTVVLCDSLNTLRSRNVEMRHSQVSTFQLRDVHIKLSHMTADDVCITAEKFYSCKPM